MAAKKKTPAKKSMVKKSSDKKPTPPPPPGAESLPRNKAAIEYMERNRRANPKQSAKIAKKVNKTAAGLAKTKARGGLRGAMGMGGGALGAYKK